MKETDIMRGVMLALSRVGTIVFRNNVGQGVVGDITWVRDKQNFTLRRGDAVVRSARVFHAGLCVGSADLIGWTPVVITPEMVGKTVAVFTAPETKTLTGVRRTEQENFIEQVCEAGGLAGFVNSEDQAVALVSGPRA